MNSVSYKNELGKDYFEAKEIALGAVAILNGFMVGKMARFRDDDHLFLILKFSLLEETNIYHPRLFVRMDFLKGTRILHTHEEHYAGEGYCFRRTSPVGTVKQSFIYELYHPKTSNSYLYEFNQHLAQREKLSGY